MKSGYQTTLRDRVTMAALAFIRRRRLSSSSIPRSSIPASVFLRTGLPGGRERLLEARRSNVTHTALCTMLGDASGASVGTVEHLLAALSGLQIDNAWSRSTGPKRRSWTARRRFRQRDRSGGRRPAVAGAPLSQGSQAGAGRTRRRLRRVSSGRARLPPRRRNRLRVAGDRAPAPRLFNLDPATFRREIARARTFGFVSDVKKLWQAGFALGSSLENSVAIDGDDDAQSRGLALRRRVRAPQGVWTPSATCRWPARRSIGVYRTYRPGHKLNAAGAGGAVRAIARPSTIVEVALPPGLRAKGHSVGAPARPPRRHLPPPIAVSADSGRLPGGDPAWRYYATICRPIVRIARAPRVADAPDWGKQRRRRRWASDVRRYSNRSSF